MRLSSRPYGLWIVTLLQFLSLVQAQTLPDPSTCADVNQNFDGCKTFQSKNQECGAISSSDQSALIACYCTQEVFSSIRDCESEVRQCVRTNENDHYFEDLLSQWETTCGPKVSFIATTPALATYTPYPGLPFCEHVYSACAYWSSEADSCSQLYTEPAQYQSCGCQADVLTLASVCQIDGASCLGDLVTTSALYSYQYCMATQTGIFTISDSTAASTGAGPAITAAGSVSVAPETSVTNTRVFVPSTISSTTAVSTTTKAGATSALNMSKVPMALVMIHLTKMLLM